MSNLVTAANYDEMKSEAYSQLVEIVGSDYYGDETEKELYDALQNTSQEDITIEEWLALTLKRIGYKK